MSCASTELCVAGDSVGNLQSGVGQVLSVTIAGVGSGSVSSLPSGISCPTACSSTFAPGTKVTLSPRPAVGSVFAGWTGGGCSGTATCLVTMSADLSVTATFASENTLTVTDAGTGSGTVSSFPGGILCPTACTSAYASSEVVTLTASPAAGSAFAGWNGACTGTSSCVVTMSSDQNVTATFNAESSLTVTVGGSGSGKVTSTPAGISCPGTCSADFATGSKVTLTAGPSSGSTFAGWSGGACSGTGGCVVTMSLSQNVKATFGTVPPQTTTTTSSPPPTKPPSCTLHAVSNRVAVKASKAHRNLKPRTLQLTVTCDQSAQVKVTGKVRSAARAKKGKKPPKPKTFRIRAVTGQAMAGAALKLTVQVPSAALKRGRNDSAGFTLTVTNANGSGTATATIRKLVLV